MRLFGRKREMNNAASAAIPQVRPIVPPGPTTIHNHSTNWFSIILAAFLCVVGGLLLAWLALQFLMSQIGSTNPGRDAAYLVLYGAGIFAAVWLLSRQAGPIVATVLDYRLDVQRELTERERVKLLAAQTSLEPGRMTEEDFKFARVILAVMMSAFDYLEANQLSEFPRRWRPWSKTSTLETAEKIGIAVTHIQALEVAKWLATEGVITSPDGGQISKRFPNLSSVRAHLDNKFGKPIMVVSPTLRDNRGFRFTEE